MIVVTGGAGFIGSNLVRALNRAGHDDILLVDELSDGRKFSNIRDCAVADYLDRDAFRLRVERRDASLGGVRAVFHQGACTDTMERDGRYMLDNNYAYSRLLLHFCRELGAQFIYASSAAVYGTGTRFVEQPDCEAPVNLYGYSKLLFDRIVRREAAAGGAQVAGLRYFNVYGPNEAHKDAMASIAFQLNRQLRETGTLKLFRGSGAYGDGEQRRDFVYVDDVVALNLWLLENPGVSGIFNAGTGVSRSFNDVARLITAWHGTGTVEYIEFPPSLEGHYQDFTEADLTALRGAGYRAAFTDLETGLSRYLDVLNGDRG